MGCTPLEALEQPLALTLGIVELRAYARAKEQVEQWEELSRRDAKAAGPPPDGPMNRWVRTVRMEAARRRASIDNNDHTCSHDDDQ